MLPLKELTHPTAGPLNLVTHLPDTTRQPDLGPKSYIAYGRWADLPKCELCNGPGWSHCLQRIESRSRKPYRLALPCSSSLSAHGLGTCCALTHHGHGTLHSARCHCVEQDGGA